MACGTNIETTNASSSYCISEERNAVLAYGQDSNEVGVLGFGKDVGDLDFHSPAKIPGSYVNSVQISIEPTDKLAYIFNACLSNLNFFALIIWQLCNNTIYIYSSGSCTIHLSFIINCIRLSYWSEFCFAQLHAHNLTFCSVSTYFKKNITFSRKTKPAQSERHPTTWCEKDHIGKRGSVSPDLAWSIGGHSPILTREPMTVWRPVLTTIARA